MTESLGRECCFYNLLMWSSENGVFPPSLWNACQKLALLTLFISAPPISFFSFLPTPFRGNRSGGCWRWAAWAKIGSLHQLPVSPAEDSAVDWWHSEWCGDPLWGEGQLSSWLPPVPSPDHDGRSIRERPHWQQQEWRAALPHPCAAGSQSCGAPLQPGPRQRHQRGEKAVWLVGSLSMDIGGDHKKSRENPNTMTQQHAGAGKVNQNVHRQGAAFN